MGTHAALHRSSSRTHSRLRRQAADRAAHLPPADSPPVITHEQVAIRAYELYQARGSAHGDELHDWFTAEMELQILAATTAPAESVSLEDDARESADTGRETS
ncbi:MAG: DUF2934 domain-containing protein [Acidobacteria bacterium]|nr:DUF2934 domain-containing protein [Acidobacteriota bacterium]